MNELIDYQSQLATYVPKELNVATRRETIVHMLRSKEGLRVQARGFEASFKYRSVQLEANKNNSTLHLIEIYSGSAKIGYVKAEQISDIQAQYANKGYYGESRVSYGRNGLITLATEMLVQVLQTLGITSFSGIIEKGNRSSWRSRLLVRDVSAGGYFSVNAVPYGPHHLKKRYLVTSQIDCDGVRLPQPMTLAEVLSEAHA